MIYSVLAAGLVAAIGAAAAGCPVVTGEPGENGSVIRVGNMAPGPRTFLIEIVDYPGSRFAHIEDVWFPVEKEHRIRVGSLMPGTVPDYLKMTAGVFADGTTCGAEDKVKLLMETRRRHLEFVAKIAGRMESSAAAGESIDKLRTELTNWARSSTGSNRALLQQVLDRLETTPQAAVLSALQVGGSLSGSWEVFRSAAGHESTQKCTFEQKAAELTGSCNSDRGPEKFTGKVEGTRVTWTVKTQHDGSPLTVVYKGSIDSADKMSGTVSAIEYGIDGEFQATRSK